MNIWVRFKGRQPEKVDTCTPKNAGYLVGEYQLAYGRDCVVWAGRKCDEPREDGGRGFYGTTKNCHGYSYGR